MLNHKSEQNVHDRPFKYGPLGWFGHIVAVLAQQEGENNLVKTI